MLALVTVLSFPLLLAAGYGLAFVLSGRDARVLLGPAGFLLYLALLAVPLTVVLASEPELPAKALAWGPWSPAWLALGLAAGLGLWGLQLVFPGRRPPTDGASSPIWVGPPGRAGFALLLVPVGCIVLAEELVWRAFLQQWIGVPLAALAFALHHYHFGARHILFSFVAGLVWGALFLAAGNNLWPALASHLLYNALAWRHLRRRAGARP
jgi:membrane protease YdiL (CAAX protease family)